jgi:DNA-directed RNA polymerase specialized sigma24 family protein
VTTIGKVTVIGNRPARDEEVGAGIISDFEDFVTAVEPRLRRALVAICGSEEGRDATAEALAYAWEHWERVECMANPVGYLFRVAQSRARRRRTPALFVPPEGGDPRFEPRLPEALRSLPEQQRLAVVLVHGFGWRASEVAELTGVKPTTTQNHLERGLRRLRKTLGVDENAI